MALIKTAISLVPVALIPVVCGNPCAIRGGGDDGFFVETGLFETGLTGESVFIDSASFTCSPDSQVWFFNAEVSGPASLATLYLRYDDGIQLQSEFHNFDGASSGMVSNFVLDLAIVSSEAWEPGWSTGVPCEAEPYPNLVYIFEVFTFNEQFGDCILVGEKAGQYEDEFPSCRFGE